jgi:hypothetical protein
VVIIVTRDVFVAWMGVLLYQNWKIFADHSFLHLILRLVAL